MLRSVLKEQRSGRAYDATNRLSHFLLSLRYLRFLLFKLLFSIDNGIPT
jgi:hypothetical protein